MHQGFEPPTVELPRIAALTDFAAGSPAAARAEPAAAAAAVVPTPSQPSAKNVPAWRAPGLDGVRALAVLAVLAFHESLPWIPGGFLGVDIFFVLSGFLITDLLVARYRKDGKVGLSSFWQRRARRLLPALALMLVCATAAVALLEPELIASLRPALLGAVTYTSNWWQAFAKVSYFQRYGPPPPFQHLWSLAVEEQFYLLWPLIIAVVVVVLRRPVLRALVAWAGALASALVMLAIYKPGSDPSLVYYGTDTHASALMIGAALALTWPLVKVATATGRIRLILDVAGLAGLAVLGWAMWHFSGADPFLYPYAPGRVGSVFSWKPLRWLGIRSYGIYLWHWPVIAITAGRYERHATTAPARVIDALLPIGLAAASWRWLEEPILRNGLRTELAHRGRLVLTGLTSAWRAPVAALPVITAAALLAITGVAAYGITHPPTGPTLQQQIKQGAQIVSSTQPYPWWLRDHSVPYRGKSMARPSRPPRVPGYKVMAIGDSVMLASAPELAQAIPGIYVNAQVSRAMIAGVAIVQHTARSRRLRPVVIVGLGTNGPITGYQIRQLRAAIGDRWLILINTFVPRPWEHEVNTTIAGAARRYPNVLLVNWYNAIDHHTNLLWSDGIHPQPIGGKLYAKVVRAVVIRALRTRPRLYWPAPKVSPLRGYPVHSRKAELY
jgi:peptidoglycan/LPS O-acetylase OafA/YrhL